MGCVLLLGCLFARKGKHIFPIWQALAGESGVLPRGELVGRAGRGSLVGYLGGSLVGYLGGSLVGYLGGSLVGYLGGSLVGYLGRSLVGYLGRSLVGYLKRSCVGYFKRSREGREPALACVPIAR